VVAHQHAGVDAASRLLACLGQRFQPAPPILITLKNGPPRIASGQHLIKRSGKLRRANKLAEDWRTVRSIFCVHMRLDSKCALLKIVNHDASPVPFRARARIGPFELDLGRVCQLRRTATSQKNVPMKLGIVLPWLGVAGLLAASVSLYSSNQTKDAELAKLREASQQAQRLSAELAEVKEQAQAQRFEIARLRSDTEDLLRLRNEVRQLGEEKQQALKRVQSAQAAADQAQQQLQTQTQQTRQIFQTSACINNLRQLDAAKQQWALENKKSPVAVPTVQDILPYLPGRTMPVCPAGGQYTLNAVNQLPTCSITGHVLPK
jgi:hypothetical protein